MRGRRSGQTRLELCYVTAALNLVVADADARNFIFLYLFFFFIFGLHLLPAHVTGAILVIRTSTRTGTEQKHVFITFSLVLLGKLFFTASFVNMKGGAV